MSSPTAIARCVLAGAALLALSVACVAQAGPVERMRCPGNGDRLEREAIHAEVSAFYRDLRAQQWAALLDHFWPAKIAARWEPPVADPAWQDSPRAGSAPAEDASACECPIDDGSGAPASTEIHVVAAWARMLLTPCGTQAAGPEPREEHGVEELWLLHVNDRWKIVHFASGVPRTMSWSGQSQPGRILRTVR
jgi:hypothetical protein